MTKGRAHEALPPNRLRQIALAFPLDWSSDRRFRLPDSRGLGSYYISWDPGTGTYGEDWEVAPHDERGVLLSGSPVKFYHPIRIAQYALHLHERLKNGDDGARRPFLAQARWLRDNQMERFGVPGCYVFPFAWTKYGAEPGWISAMAQGEAISVLLRADEVTPGFGYGGAALRAAEPFRLPLSHGGVVWRGAEGATFFEEVAVEPAAHILNGGLFAMFGLYDLVQCGGPEWVRGLFDDAAATVLRYLSLFDSGRWSYYSLLAGRHGHRHVATLKYHAFHIAQLRVLSGMTGDGYFAVVAGDWLRYQRSLASRVWAIGHEMLGLIPRFVTHDDTVARGAHAIV